MSFEEPRGHADIVRGLWRSARAERLPHALLLRGAPGIGKFLSLQWLALGLLCESGPGEPCRQCGACKRVLSDNHPDLFTLDVAAEGEELIKVGRIAARDDEESGRSVEGFLRLRAHEGGWRIVLIREAERMNESAQNAFLKTLEEPSQRTLLALESSSPGQLLTTVHSRVIGIDLERLDQATTRAIVAGLAIDPEDAALYARQSGGAPGEALTRASRSTIELRALLVAAQSGVRSPTEVARAIWEVAGEFPGKTASAAQRLRVRVCLDLGLELLLDAERAVAGVPLDELAHGDVVEEFTGTARARREWRLEEWLRARQDVMLNMSAEAILDRALMALEPEAQPVPGRS